MHEVQRFPRPFHWDVCQRLIAHGVHDPMTGPDDVGLMAHYVQAGSARCQIQDLVIARDPLTRQPVAVALLAGSAGQGLVHVYVKPEARGQGVAHALLSALMTKATLDDGASSLRGHHNPLSERLFLAHGIAPVHAHWREGIALGAGMRHAARA